MPDKSTNSQIYLGWFSKVRRLAPRFQSWQMRSAGFGRVCLSSFWWFVAIFEGGLHDMFLGGFFEGYVCLHCKCKCKWLILQYSSGLSVMICALDLEVAGNLHNKQLKRTPSFAFFATITGFILQPCFTPSFFMFFPSCIMSCATGSWNLIPKTLTKQQSHFRRIDFPNTNVFSEIVQLPLQWNLNLFNIQKKNWRENLWRMTYCVCSPIF